MKETILKVLMILTFIVSGMIFLNGINLTIQEILGFIAGEGFQGSGIAWIVISSTLIALAGLIQYIILENFHPLYLFKRKN